jgi:hypothetical protein
MIPPTTHPAGKSPPVPLPAATQEMLKYFPVMSGLSKDYWPENEPRVIKRVGDLQRLVPVLLLSLNPDAEMDTLAFSPAGSDTRS